MKTMTNWSRWKKKKKSTSRDILLRRPTFTKDCRDTKWQHWQEQQQQQWQFIGWLASSSPPSEEITVWLISTTVYLTCCWRVAGVLAVAAHHRHHHRHHRRCCHSFFFIESVVPWTVCSGKDDHLQWFAWLLLSNEAYFCRLMSTVLSIVFLCVFLFTSLSPHTHTYSFCLSPLRHT